MHVLNVASWMPCRVSAANTQATQTHLQQLHLPPVRHRMHMVAATTSTTSTCHAACHAGPCIIPAPACHNRSSSSSTTTTTPC
jgi:hypothetical protein